MRTVSHLYVFDTVVMNVVVFQVKLRQVEIILVVRHCMASTFSLYQLHSVSSRLHYYVQVVVTLRIYTV